MKKACLITAVTVAVLLHSTASRADEIRVLSSVGIKAVVDELAPQFEKATKHKVTMVFGLAGALKAQIEKGEPFDVAILTPPLLDDLIAKGLVPAKSTIARTGLGLMIKAGAHKPDISTVDAFKKTLLAATVDHVRIGRRQRSGISGDRQAAWHRGRDQDEACGLG